MTCRIEVMLESEIVGFKDYETIEEALKEFEALSELSTPGAYYRINLHEGNSK